MHKVIVAGSRTITEYGYVEGLLSQLTAGGSAKPEIVSGGADGVDSLGEQWAAENGCDVVTFEPEWDTYGPSAGPIRNQEMAEYADTLVAVWDGESPGTRNMIEVALEQGLDIHVKQV